MAPSRDFEPQLRVDDVTVTGRDVEMLRAVDREGSMSAAADALGRSYPHLQRRVVELEEALGSLTTRVRGGEGGGGTELTGEAREVIRQFERLRSELAGVTAVAESVLPGTVVERRGELATVATPAGELTARVPPDAADVEVAVRADAVVLIDPDSTDRTHTSLRNQLPGTVAGVDRRGTVAGVTVEVADGVEVESEITAESLSRLDLSAGDPVVAAFKSTAARATEAEV